MKKKLSKSLRPPCSRSQCLWFHKNIETMTKNPIDEIMPVFHYKNILGLPDMSKITSNTAYVGEPAWISIIRKNLD